MALISPKTGALQPIAIRTQMGGLWLLFEDSVGCWKQHSHGGFSLGDCLIRVTYCGVKFEGNTRSSTDTAVVRGSSHIHVGYSCISEHGGGRDQWIHPFRVSQDPIFQTPSLKYEPKYHLKVTQRLKSHLVLTSNQKQTWSPPGRGIHKQWATTVPGTTYTESI